MEAEIYALQQTREQLWRAYTRWRDEELNGTMAANQRAVGFYEGYADAIEYMGHLTRFRQLEQIVASVHAHDRNVEILNDCIQQIKDELGG